MPRDFRLGVCLDQATFDAHLEAIGGEVYRTAPGQAGPVPSWCKLEYLVPLAPDDPFTRFSKSPTLAVLPPAAE